MKRFQQNIRKVVPYVPGDQPDFPDMIKLNTNESPYPPAPEVQEVLAKSNAEQMRLYPDPTAHQLNAAIAEAYGVEEAQVFTGVGSDDVLAMIFQTFFNSDLPILFPDITYAFYPVWCDLFRIPYEVQPLNEKLEIVPEDYYKPNGGIVFPNPNAPTGLALPRSAIEGILQANPDNVVIVDEAYVDFGGESCVPLIDRYENLLVVQTFSKSRQLAGARLGLAMGNAKLIADLNRVKFSLNPYNINRLTLKAGQAALEDTAYFDRTRAAIVDTRAWTKQQLEARGFAVLDSRSNFLFASTQKKNGGELYRKLKEKGVLVRHFDAPRIENWLRITIGTPEQMQIFLNTLDKIMEE